MAKKKQIQHLTFKSLISSRNHKKAVTAIDDEIHRETNYPILDADGIDDLWNVGRRWYLYHKMDRNACI